MRDFAASLRVLRRARTRLGAALLTLAALGPLTLVAAAAAEPAAAQTNQLADPVVFRGGGWGHGVGMSQYGAYGRAASGQSAAQILATYYQNTVLGPYAVTNDLRIRLGRQNDVTLEPSAPVSIVIDGVNRGAVGAGTPIQVTYTGSAVQVVAPDACLPSCVGAELVVPLALDQPLRVSATGNRYHRGRIRVIPDGTSMLILNDGLTMDQYLYGLAEMPSSWPAAALQAQAVAGRSYAQSRVAARRASNSPYDLFATTTDQAFSGYDKERGAQGSNWVAAVNATSGQVLTSGGVPITAFYTSSNGGHSENSEYAFSEALPYARGVADPFDSYQNPFATWERSYSIADLSRWLAAASDTNVGTLRSIEMTGSFGVSGRNDKATVRLVGTTATRTVTGARFRTVVNAGVTADGGGLSRQLLSTKYNIANVAYSPEGNFESLRQSGPAVLATGWALDRNSTSPVEVHVYVDGAFAVSGSPTEDRDDVAAITGTDVLSGFAIGFRAAPGPHTVCLYVINVGPPEPNPSLGCRSVTVTDRIPFGNNERVVARSAELVFDGWVFDPDAPTTPVEVHVYAGSTFLGAGVADGLRTDVGAVFGVGPNHGYSVTVTVPAGTPLSTPVCAYAVNAGPGTTNPAILCRTLEQLERPPIGTIDIAEASLGTAGGSTGAPVTTVRFAGWTADGNDLDGSTEVHVWAGGQMIGAAPATTFRPDVASAFRVRGNYGYDVSFPVPAGLPTNAPICAYAINIGPGSVNPALGCRTLDQMDRRPAGSIDSVAVEGTELRVSGWAVDRDAPDTAIGVHVYVDGRPAGAGGTGIARPDVAAAFGVGASTGYSFTVPAPAPGRHQVCIYGINAGPGSVNPNLACRTVTI